jgi:pimeloyl-ACP methyl ester carboxylesterase
MRRGIVGWDLVFNLHQHPIVSKMLEVLCFPGWSAQRRLSQWQGRTVSTIPHTDQWEFLCKGTPPSVNWLPHGPWVLVTWSMGTWTGFKCSAAWGENPPKAWLALSPFIHLTGPSHCKIKKNELAILLEAFREQPQKTLDLFCRQQGGKIPWSEGEQPEDFLTTLTDSLGALLESPPYLPKQKISVPTWAIWGERDRLVNTEMVGDFCQYFDHANHLPLPAHGHGLFYEDVPVWPKELKE